MLASTTGWKLTNHHKTYLSVQCDVLCNCYSSVPITYQCLTILLFKILWRWSGFGMLILGKTQKKHPGDLPPTIPDLPLPHPHCMTDKNVDAFISLWHNEPQLWNNNLKIYYNVELHQAALRRIMAQLEE